MAQFPGGSSLGYLGGAALSFGVRFLDFLPFLQSGMARLTIVLFGMGVLGATIYSSEFWAQDIDEAIDDPSVRPHFFDFFGYLTTIVGGGITGVVLYLAVKAGLALSVVAGEVPELRGSAALVIAFCGGLFHFRVKRSLQSVIAPLLRKENGRRMTTPE